MTLSLGSEFMVICCDTCGRKHKSDYKMIASGTFRFCGLFCKSIHTRVPNTVGVETRERNIPYPPKHTERDKAIWKVAYPNVPVCAVCGCPHSAAFTIGHFNNDGNDHRFKLREMKININKWILISDVKSVQKMLQIECVYCQYFHAKNKRYPSDSEKPIWI